MRSLGLPLLFLTAFTLPSTNARAAARTGESVIISRDEVVRENLYVGARDVAVHGTVVGDVLATGGTIIVDGVVHGDVLAVGAQVTITGMVDGDVRALGGQVSVTGPVTGDAVLAGGNLTVDADIGGDAMLAGGAVNVAGKVARTLYISGGQMMVNGKVGSGVHAQGNQLTLGETAEVTGAVVYAGVQALETSQGAVVRGTVSQEAIPPPQNANRGIVGWLQALFGVYVMGLLWLAFFRRFAGAATDVLVHRPGLSAGVGFAALVGAPLAALVVLVTGALVGGWWLGFMGMAVFGMAVALAFPLVALTVGNWAAARMELPPQKPAAMLLASLVVLLLAMQVPVLGALLGLAVVTLGVGAIGVAMFNTLRFTRGEYHPPMTTTAAPA